MIERSNTLNHKGRHAMVKMERFDLAEDLFSLSMIYHDKNTSTLINIATLGFSTGDMGLVDTSLAMLDKIGHRSPEASILQYLLAEQRGNTEEMALVKLIMKVTWPNSK